MSNKLKLFLVLVLCWVGLQAGANFKIATYNLEWYGQDPTDDASREDDFRIVLQSLNPDVLVCEEVVGNTGYTNFLNHVLNYNGTVYDGVFIDQTAQQDIALYFRADSFQVLAYRLVDITSNPYLRDALEVKLQHMSTGRIFRVYGLHLKANTSGDNSENLAVRAAQTQALREYLNSLPSGSWFFVTGDFNMLNASETGWQNLTISEEDNDGRCYDPTGQVGEWDDNSAFAAVHTHSTRYYAGGLTTRFDFILVSQGIVDNDSVAVPDSTYITFGNDGQHFGSSVNWGANASVPDSVADALYTASDHLPVAAMVFFTGGEAIVPVDTNHIYISEYADAPGSGNYIYEFVELYNPATTAVNLSGAVLEQINSSWSLTLPEETVVPAGGFLVVARDADSVSFTNFWYVQWGPEVVFVNSGGAFPKINGSEQFRLLSATGEALDPIDGQYTAIAVSADQRVIRTGIGNLPGDYTTDAADQATPGSLESGQPVTITPVFPVNPMLMEFYPNPFNNSGHIVLQFDFRGKVRLELFDIRGRRLQSLYMGEITPGRMNFTFKSRGLASGPYFLRLQTPLGVTTRRILLLK